MSEELPPLLERIRRPLVLATVGGLFLAFVAWIGPQFRDDLWIMRFEEGCHDGNQEDCASLGWRYMKGTGVPEDVVRGRQMLADACHEGVVWACAAVGNTHWWSSAEAVLLTQEQTDSATKRCKQGDTAACDVVSIAGLDVRRSPAEKETRKRCLDGDFVACWAILPGAIQDGWDGLPKICELGFKAACDEYKNPDQVHKTLYWRTKFSDAWFRESRTVALDLWARGEMSDEDFATKLAEMCEIDALSCVLAAKVRAKNSGALELAQDWELALPWYAWACEQKSPWGCSGVGYYRRNRAWGAEEIQEKIKFYKSPPASEMFAKACDLGADQSCVDAAKMLGKEAKSDDVVRNEYERMCKAKKLRVCDALIRDLRNGTYGPPEPAKAEKIQQVLCDAGATDYCDYRLWWQRPRD